MKQKRAKPLTVDPTLTLKEIDERIAELKERAASIVESEKSGVVERIKDAIAYYGITAADLGFGKPGKPDRKPATNVVGSAKRRKAAKSEDAVKATAPVEAAAASVSEPKGRPVGRIKFKDDAGNTWSGFGPKPRWYVAALASGKTSQDLAA